MDKKTKIKELQDRLTELDKQSGGALSGANNDMGGMLRSVIQEESVSFKKELQDRPILKALDKVTKDFAQLRKDIDVKGILKAVGDASDENQGRLQDVAEEFDSKLAGLSDALNQSEQRGTTLTEEKAKAILSELADLRISYDQEKEGLVNKDSLLESELSRIAQEVSSIQKRLGESEKDDGLQKTLTQNVEDTKKAQDVADEAIVLINELRTSVNSRLAGIGGGNANRNMAVGGNTSVLSKYTDINIRAGSNVTLTYQNNETTKYLDLTISATGGGGSVGGVVRSINSISTSQTAAAVAGTDYVYICTAGVKLTLPTAVSNTNLYTVKNTSTSSVLIATTSAQTIDGGATALLQVQYTSVDLVSDNSNWDVT